MNKLTKEQQDWITEMKLTIKQEKKIKEILINMNKQNQDINRINTILKRK